ncbi:MAG: hypothetical protein ACRECF_07910 [Methyloceanibacter sp.]
MSRFKKYDPGFRQRISLFREEFLKELQIAAPFVVTMIRSRRSWYKKLIRFRDPVAHQIPVCPVRAILSPLEAQKWRQISEDATAAANRGDLDEAKRLLIEMETIGSYVAVFGYSYEGTQEVRRFWPQVHLDAANMCDIAEGVIQMFERWPSSR